MTTFFNLILAIITIAIGVFAIKNPSSKFFRRIGKDFDTEPSDERQSFTRFGGMIVIIMGLIILILGVVPNLL